MAMRAVSGSSQVNSLKADVRRRVQALLEILTLISEKGFLEIDLNQLSVSDILLYPDAGKAVVLLRSALSRQKIVRLFEKARLVAGLLDIEIEGDPVKLELVLCSRAWVVLG